MRRSTPGAPEWAAISGRDQRLGDGGPDGAQLEPDQPLAEASRSNFSQPRDSGASLESWVSSTICRARNLLPSHEVPVVLRPLDDRIEVFSKQIKPFESSPSPQLEFGCRRSRLCGGGQM
jgi:hypothetical protein